MISLITVIGIASAVVTILYDVALVVAVIMLWKKVNAQEKNIQIINRNIEDVFRRIDEATKDAQETSIRYTDSRIDKVLNK